jgi:hypothetical protein
VSERSEDLVFIPWWLALVFIPIRVVRPPRDQFEVEEQAVAIALCLHLGLCLLRA